MDDYLREWEDQIYDGPKQKHFPRAAVIVDWVLTRSLYSILFGTGVWALFYYGHSAAAPLAVIATLSVCIMALISVGAALALAFRSPASRSQES